MTLALDLTARAGNLDVAVALAVERGETVAVVGPNGAGKTTLLRAIAGLVPLARGTVALDGEVLEDTSTGKWVPPERRSMGVVFQERLLFPHLSALENVAFGLRCRGATRTSARAEARAWLERVGLGETAKKRAAELSGGEAQRVALARALATRPRVLLLDEPLTALDAAIRPATRRDLRRHLDEHDGMRLLVTHDPLDALALADRVAVLEEGRVVQVGTPADLAARPGSRYVAELVGTNLLHGTARVDNVLLRSGATLTVPDAGTGDVAVVIHPRAVALHRARPEGSPRNAWEAVVEHVEPEGQLVRVTLSGTVPLTAEITTAALAELGFARGARVWCSVKAAEITAYPE